MVRKINKITTPITDQSVALYIRVSTLEQAESGFSIDAQKERLAAYCKSQGWDEFRYYIDDGYTGTNTDRPELQRMIKHIEQGKISSVVVYRLDRLSRKQKDVLELLEDVFEKYECSFKSATEPFDTSTPFGKAMLGMLSVFAQLERDTIIERTTSGLRQRVMDGKWHGGRVPFGYDWNSKTQQLIINPEQAELYKHAVSMYLRGASRLQIAEELVSKSNDRVFDHSVVRDMLARPVYAGLLPTHDGSVVDGLHDGIIDIETWRMIQEETRRRSGKRESVSKDKEHLLSGILECGLCGSPMYRYVTRTSRNGKKYEYPLYACVNQHVRNKDKKVHCKQGYKNVEKLDQLVVDHLRKFVISPELFEKEIEHIQKPSDNLKAVKKQLIDKLADIERRLDKYYKEFEEDTLDPKRFKKRIKELQDEQKQIEERIEEIEDKETTIVNSDKTFNAVAALTDTWDEMTLIERQQALRMVIDKVIVQPDWDIQIKWAT